MGSKTLVTTSACELAGEDVLILLSIVHQLLVQSQWLVLGHVHKQATATRALLDIRIGVCILNSLKEPSQEPEPLLFTALIDTCLPGCIGPGKVSVINFFYIHLFVGLISERCCSLNPAPESNRSLFQTGLCYLEELFFDCLKVFQR